MYSSLLSVMRIKDLVEGLDLRDLRRLPSDGGTDAMESSGRAVGAAAASSIVTSKLVVSSSCFVFLVAGSVVDSSSNTDESSADFLELDLRLDDDLLDFLDLEDLEALVDSFTFVS